MSESRKSYLGCAAPGRVARARPHVAPLTNPAPACNTIGMGTKKRKSAAKGPQAQVPPLKNEAATGVETSLAPNERPTVHVIGLHHTIPDESFSHCAFTGKVTRFPAVLHAAGYRVVEYSNGPDSGPDIPSNAPAGTVAGVAHHMPDQHVSIFSEAQLETFFGREGLRDHTTTRNNLDQNVKGAFLQLVERGLRQHAKAGDIVAHVYAPEPAIVAALPDCIHVETGIGYGNGPIKGVYRIFESESWRAWHFGKYTLSDNGGGATWPNYPQVTGTSVVPNYYETSDWALGDGRGCNPQGVPCPDGDPYVLFVGRMSSAKGIDIINALALRFPDLTFVMISGEPACPDRMTAPNIHWVGRVTDRRELARWYGGALCTLVPSRFHEPFGGVHVESLLCGTPVLTSDFAVFTETVQDGDGLRCMTEDDFAFALGLVANDQSGEWAGQQSREERRIRAQLRWGIEPVALRYRGALESFRRQHAKGIVP